MAGRTGLGSARTQGRSQRQRLQHAVLRAFLAARTARLGSGRLWRPARHRRRRRRSRTRAWAWPPTTQPRTPKGKKPGWRRLGGTSVGAPLIAAAFALAGGAHGVRLSGADAVPERRPGSGAAARRHDRHQRRLPARSRARLHARRTGGRLHGTADLRRRPRVRRTHRPREPATGSGRWSRAWRSGRPPPAPARRGGSFAVEAVIEATGQAVTVDSTTPAVCTATAGEVTLLAAGTCTLAAAQPGYLEAQQSFTVARTPQHVGFSSTAPTDAVEGGPAYQPAVVCQLRAAGGAGLADAGGVRDAGGRGRAAGGGHLHDCGRTGRRRRIRSGPVGDPVLPGGGPGSPASGIPAGGAPAGEVLSLHEAATPFAATATLDLQVPSRSRGATGRSRFSLAVSPGGTVRWQMTFTHTTRCPLHGPLVRGSDRALRLREQGGRGRHPQAHGPSEPGGPAGAAEPAHPPRSGAADTDHALRERCVRARDERRAVGTAALRSRTATVLALQSGAAGPADGGPTAAWSC